ncbi:MAG: type III secretion system ATPase SctN [Blastocatellia bacterium]
MRIDLSSYIRLLDHVTPVETRGRVREITGLLLRASVPGARVGEICLIRSPFRHRELLAEVVGFRDGDMILMPLGDITDVEMGAEVIPTRRLLNVRVSHALLGRVLDGLGHPMDNGGELDEYWEYAVTSRPPDPLQRKQVRRPFSTGVRAIDGLLTVGEGQRFGVFAAAGVGKSTLLGMLARNCEADINVIGLIGERGREVRDFIEDSLGPEGMKRSVIVVATSNEPALMRMKAAYVTTAIAEYFRDCGHKVMLLMDSVTRFARALREVGLAAGEPPARSGFPPSVFSELPRLLERTGNSDRGSITAFYTVLVEGDDMTEPIADETRSILDGHMILSRALASAGHYPAIDIGQSISRVMSSIADPEHIEAARQLRETLATYEAQKDFILIGAYKKGSDKRVDYALSKLDAVNGYLRQHTHESVTADEAIAQLRELF